MTDYSIGTIKHYNKKYHQHMNHDLILISNDGVTGPYSKNSVIISVNQAQRINDIYNSNPNDFSNIGNLDNDQAWLDESVKIEEAAGIDVNKQHDNYNQTNFINKYYHGKNKNIINLYVKGMGPKHIARKLHVSQKKVKHVIAY